MPRAAPASYFKDVAARWRKAARMVKNDEAAKVAADRSRATASRSDYEVDVADLLMRLGSSKAGATFDPEAYQHDVVVESVKLS